MRQEVVSKLHIKVDNILSNLATLDWWSVNKNSKRVKYGIYTPSGKIREWESYSLSDDTIEAQEILNLLRKENISIKEEVIIKTFITKYYRFYPKYIEDKHFVMNNISKEIYK